MKLKSIFLILSLKSVLLFALPEKEQVVTGSVSFSKKDNILNITSNSEKAIINYDRFNISNGETVNIIQKDPSAKILNRVTGQDISHIDGILKSNGIVYLVNKQGIFIGKNALIDVASFVSAAANISNQDFLKDINRFTEVQGSIVNKGTIKAKNLLLFAENIQNEGIFDIDNQVVSITSNDDIILSKKNSDVFIKLPKAKNGKFKNTNKIRAKKCFLEAKDIYALAKSEIISDELYICGDEKSSLNLEGKYSGKDIKILGDEITLKKVDIDATQDNKGGSVYIGGDYKGEGDLYKASKVYIDNDSVIDASAKINGDGGKVIVWSEKSTIAKGNIKATGGTLSGSGGFIETSSHGYLNINELSVDTISSKGKNGTWLIDPTNIWIKDPGDPAVALTDVDQFLDADKDVNGSELDVSKIESAGADITLQATNNIYFEADFFSNLANSQNITADAGGSITVTNPISTTKNLFFTANSSLSPTQTNTGAIAVNEAITVTSTGAVTLLVHQGSGQITVNEPITTESGNITINKYQGTGDVNIYENVSSTSGRVRFYNTATDGAIAVYVAPAGQAGIHVIQNAIDAILGNPRINLSIFAGTYNEYIEVPKAMSIFFQDTVYLNGFVAYNSQGAISIGGKMQVTATGFGITFIGPVNATFDTTLSIGAPSGSNSNQLIAFQNTLDAVFPRSTNITLNSNSLIFNNYVGKNVPFNIININNTPCSNIEGKQFIIGYNQLLTQCTAPFPSSAANPVNSMASNFGIAKIISSDKEIQNILDEAQQRYMIEVKSQDDEDVNEEQEEKSPDVPQKREDRTTNKKETDNTK